MIATITATAPRELSSGFRCRVKNVRFMGGSFSYTSRYS
jgi:hypothetical protein